LSTSGFNQIAILNKVVVISIFAAIKKFLNNCYLKCMLSFNFSLAKCDFFYER